VVTFEPIHLLIHLACPGIEYTDRGKSAVTLAGAYETVGDLMEQLIGVVAGELLDDDEDE
jgi:hypothetical protein